MCNHIIALFCLCRKQFATIEQSADAVESRLKEELTDLKQASIDKCEELKKELDLEKAKHNAKMDELADRHKVEIKKLRENHDRVVEEVKYEYNTIIENIKQSKQAESGVFENASSYNDKLESNLQMLGINSKILFDLKEKVEKDYGVLHMAREESLKAKEEEIKCSVFHMIRKFWRFDLKGIQIKIRTEYTQQNF